jgi:hypothetical protein
MFSKVAQRAVPASVFAVGVAAVSFILHPVAHVTVTAQLTPPNFLGIFLGLAN